MGTFAVAGLVVKPALESKTSFCSVENKTEHVAIVQLSCRVSLTQMVYGRWEVLNI